MPSLIAIAAILIFLFLSDSFFRIFNSVNESLPPDKAMPRFSCFPIKPNFVIVLNTLFSKYSIKCFLQRLSPAVNWFIGFSLQQFSIFIRLNNWHYFYLIIIFELFIFRNQFIVSCGNDGNRIYF